MSISRVKVDHVELIFSRVSYGSLSMSDPDPELQIRLTEYSAVRESYLRWRDSRVTTLSAGITVSAAFIGIGLERHSAPLLAATAVVATLFGFLNIHQTYSMRQSTDYLAKVVEPAINGRYPGVMGWHLPNEVQERRRPIVIFVLHFPMVVAVILPGSLGLVGSMLTESNRGALSLQITGVVLVTLYTTFYWLLLIQRDIRSWRELRHKRQPRQ